MQRVSALLVAACASSLTASQAMFVERRLADVPVERLLTNLTLAEQKCSDDKCKADIEYRIARLHAMCYARQKTTVTIDRNDDPKTALHPVLSPYEEATWPDDRQYETSKQPLDESARQALIQAIKHYQLSLQFEPNDVKALLGLGWCLSEHKDYSDAKAALRKAVSLAKKIESSTPDKTVFFGGFSYESRRVQEAALYLVPLLDSQQDAAEIKELSSLGKPDYELHFETPIVVLISAKVSDAKLMRKCSITFDIDGFGNQNLSEWPSRDAGWLVWDPREKGTIRSGAELIGSNTFQIIWKNGYEVLSALDDNHDGEVSGNELAGLSLWVDKNSNGKSDPGEVLPLKYFDISALSCHFTQRGNVIANQHGVRFASGKVASTRDWVYTLDRGPDQFVTHKNFTLAMCKSRHRNSLFQPMCATSSLPKSPQTSLKRQHFGGLTMVEFSQLKSAPSNVENTAGSAIESAGAAAGKAAREASLKLSNEGNSRPDSGTPKRADSPTANISDGFFTDNGDTSRAKRITADDIRELEKTEPMDNSAKNAPPDVMKAIEAEKKRIKTLKDAGDAATTAVKSLPELHIE